MKLIRKLNPRGVFSAHLLLLLLSFKVKSIPLLIPDQTNQFSTYLSHSIDSSAGVFAGLVSIRSNFITLTLLCGDRKVIKNATSPSSPTAGNFGSTLSKIALCGVVKVERLAVKV